jgi:hypothetical protein
MSRRKSTGESKTEATAIPVTVADQAPAWVPVVLGTRLKATPRPCGQPEVLKTDEIGKKGQGGEFIKRGGKLFRS